MKLTKKVFVIGLPILLSILIVSFVTIKKVSPLSAFWWGKVNVEDSIAAHQFDLVSYFSGTAQQGEKQFTADYEGVTYYFGSIENKQTFNAEPSRYIPQFGGYCAFATSKGFTADTDPQAWTIVADKLYFFADNSVKKEWVETMGSGSLTRSHDNWNAAF